MSGKATPQNESPSDRVRKLLDPYDKLRLECDGFTQVAHYVLKKAKIPHTVYHGSVVFGAKGLPLHFWIMLDDTTAVDYRLRMWFGDSAPHGVYEYNNDCPVVYDGEPTTLNVTDFIFDILTMDWEKLQCDPPK